MKKIDIENGTNYLIEIKSLEEVYGIISAYGWKTKEGYAEPLNSLSLLGTDYGKPNATEQMTKFAEGNREMFDKIKKIINERIIILEEEFKEL